MTTTPGPWQAIPHAETTEPDSDALYPHGTWLVVGPDDDNDASHTIAVCMPCDDDTHPGRAEADAKLIASYANSV